MKPNHGLSQYFMKRKLFCAVVPLLMLARLAGATVSFAPLDPNNGQFAPYEQYNYLIPPNVAPNVDATNFVIDNSFTINFNNYGVNSGGNGLSVEPFFESENTLNYSNNGTMTANTGFWFDRLTTNSINPRQMAGNFYNPGTVTAGSTADSGSGIFGSSSVNFLSEAGQIVVSATNVINPGTLDVGYGGYIKVIGTNVDLDGGIFTVEGQPFNVFNLGQSSVIQATFSGTGLVALPTTGWNPSQNLGATFAYSSTNFVNLLLNNTTPYTDWKRVPNTTNSYIFRAVFLLNDNPNLTPTVYLGDPNNSDALGSVGAAHIQWYRTYLDPATGQTLSDYLYLTDDYVGSAATNATVTGGLPSAFSLVSASAPVGLTGQVSPGLTFNFPNALYTNRFSYMSGDVIAGQSSTNVSTTNPYGTVTNLPGRIQIVSSNSLSMANAFISSGTYVSLVCSNQFLGSPGAYILAPYSDMNLGESSGTMTVSNLLLADIPQWNGLVEAWSTRWVYVDSGGNTNDFRVLLVHSGANLLPSTPPWIHNLSLHATNSLYVTDALNVYGSFYSDAQNFTLETNLVGNGATSLDGELNFDSGASFGTGQMPDLVWLTNNGTMTCLNSVSLGNNYTSFTYLTTNYTFTGTNPVAHTATNTLPAYWLGALINNGVMTNQTTIANAVNFTNSGIINSGSGAFLLSASTASFVSGLNTNVTAANSQTSAGGDVTVTATNLVLNGANINAGHSLNLTAVQQLTDGQSNLVVNGLTNGNYWFVGTNTVGGADSGFNVTVNPFNGDLLGTTVTNFAPAAKSVVNTWAGAYRGYSLAGYSNNLAVGHLILDTFTNISGQKGTFTFIGTGGTGVTNAMYVDCLELRDYATNLDASYNPVTMTFNTNFVIYYAQALINGVSAAEKLDHKGLDSKGNGNHLRWMPSYVGYFSYTNLAYPNGTTNAVNAALANSTQISSDGLNGGHTPNNNNGVQTYQIFVPSEINLNISITNSSARLLTWNIPATATNYYVQYLTNLLNPSWQTFTNFNISSNLIPTSATNVYCVDTNRNSARYYRVVVQPWLTYPK